MAKSTKHEAEETATIRVSKEEWKHIYNASEKTITNFHDLLHKRLYEELKGCCPFNWKQKHVRQGTQRPKAPLINITALCPISTCERRFAFLVYDKDIGEKEVCFLFGLFCY